MCIGEDMGRGLIIRTGLLLGDRARASSVYEVSMTHDAGVTQLFGLSELEFPFTLFVLIPTRFSDGSLFGLQTGDIVIGDALGVHGVRGVMGERGVMGVPGVNVSELRAEEIVLKLEGEMRESVEVEPNILHKDGAINFVSSDDSR